LFHRVIRGSETKFSNSKRERYQIFLNTTLLMIRCLMRRTAAVWTAIVFLAAAIWELHGYAHGELGRTVDFVRSVWPLGPALPANAWYVTKSFLVSGVLLVLWDSTGLRLGFWWFGKRPAGAVRLVSPLAGHAAFALALLGLAAVGLFTPGMLMAILIGLAVAGGACLPGAMRELRDGTTAIWSMLPTAGRMWTVVSALVIAPALLVPEVNRDAISYHLAFPGQLLVTHRLFGTDAYFPWLMPLPAEMSHVYALLAGADAAARLTVLGLLAAGGLAAATAFGAGAPAIVAVAMAVLVPGQRWVLATAKNDAHAAGLVLAAGALLLESGILSRRRRPALLVAAGALLGTLVATKYVLLPHALVLVAIVVFRIGFRRAAGTSLLLTAGAALLLSPWAAKGWLFLADPFYPLGSTMLPAIFGDLESNEIRRILVSQFACDPEHGRLALGMVARLLFCDGIIFIAALPWLVRGMSTGEKWLALASVLSTAVVSLVLQGDFATVERYSMPSLVLLNLIGAVVLLRNGRLGSIAAVLVVIFALRLQTHVDGVETAGFIAGRVSVDDYRYEAIPERGGIDPSIKAITEDTGTILSIGELAFWAMPKRIRMQTFEPPFVWKAARDGEAGRIRIRFRQAGIRWILYNPALAIEAAYDRRPYAWTPGQLLRYEDFCRKYLTVAGFCGRSDPGWGSSWLLKVSDQPMPPLLRILYMPGSEAAFASPILADANGDPRVAAWWWRGFRGLLPRVA